MARARATGQTITLLFTDVQGSTRLWERHPRAMPSVMARHDEVVARVVEASGGRVVKPRGEGDSVFAVFPAAGAAAQSAVEMQRALSRETWPEGIDIVVRAAIHTGSPVERDADFYGPDVNRCARLRAVAHGGQILLTGTTAAALAGELPEGCSLVDLGVHHLKDLEAPEHVRQISADGLRAVFPPLPSTSSPHNLPEPASSFGGRDADVVTIGRALDEHRLVTLIGAPGIGKTRLAIETLRVIRQRFPDGVWMVGLGRCVDAEAAFRVVAAALDLPARATPDAAAIVEHLRERRSLLLLDAVDVVAPAVAQLTQTVLSSCPEVRVVCTAAAPLAVYGEAQVRVEPLGRADSVELFLDRAGLVLLEGGAAEADRVTARRICQSIGGVPRDIEAAAARLAGMSLPELERALAEDPLVPEPLRDPTLARSGLLERDEQLREVGRSLDVLPAGRGITLIASGEAGIGKSSLLGAAGDAAMGRGYTVLTARGGELESGYAYGVVRQMFQPWLARAGPGERETLLGGPAAAAAAALGLGAGEPAEDRFAAFNGLYWLCANLCERGPLVLVVDDAHWADAESLQFLGYAARRTADLPLLLLVAVRPEEQVADPRLLHALLDAPGARVLVPAPLTLRATERLLEAALGAADADFVATCHEVTGGNPFYLRELIAEVEAVGLTPRGASVAEVRRLGPRAIAAAVLVRLARMGPGERELAQALAVLGHAVPLAQAAAVAGLDAQVAQHAADRLAAAGILRDARPLDFQHAILRASIAADMPRARVSALHAKAARMLTDDLAPPEQVAGHLLNVDPEGNAAVVEVVAAAADRAIADGAPASALALLRRALQEPPPVERRTQLRLKLARAGLEVGDADAIRSAVDVARGHVEPQPRAEAALLLVESRGAVPPEEIAELLAAAYDALPADSRAGDLGTLLQLHLAAAHADHDVRRLVPALRELHARTAPGPARAEIAAQLAHAIEATGAGHVDEVVDLAEDALKDARHPTQVWMIASALNNAGRVARASSVLDAEIAATRRSGSEVGFVWLTVQQTFVALNAGRLRDAEAACRTGLEIAGRWGHEAHWVDMARGNLATVLLDRGALDEAESVLSEMRGRFEDRVSWPDRHLLWSRGRLRLVRGDAAGAAADLELLGHTLRQDGALNPAFWPWRQDAAAALVRVGREEEARRLADEEAELAAAYGEPAAIARAGLTRARAYGGPERVAWLQESARVLADTAFRLDEARVLVELGSALRREGQRRAAQDSLRSGMDVATRCGAKGLADWAHEELLASGARPRRARTTGPESLTPAELRIAKAAADGMTNRQIAESLFLSTKTVEMHLGRIYRKLDIGSRAQVAATVGSAE